MPALESAIPPQRGREQPQFHALCAHWASKDELERATLASHATSACSKRRRGARHVRFVEPRPSLQAARTLIGPSLPKLPNTPETERCACRTYRVLLAGRHEDLAPDCCNAQPGCLGARSVPHAAGRCRPRDVPARLARLHGGHACGLRNGGCAQGALFVLLFRGEPHQSCTGPAGPVAQRRPRYAAALAVTVHRGRRAASAWRRGLRALHAVVLPPHCCAHATLQAAPASVVA